jgi:hypothetical protein
MSVHGGTLHHQGSNVAVVPLLKNVPKYYKNTQNRSTKSEKKWFYVNE